MAVVAYRATTSDPWSIHKCRRAGEIDFDDVKACHLARWYCLKGNAEAQVLKGAEIFARFFRTPTGNVVQEGGVQL